MTRDLVKAEDEVLTTLGQKIGIANLSMQDYDLVFADAEGVEKYCDQFEMIDLTPAERFYFMMLIVASLDLALDKRVPGCEASEQRVQTLLSRDLADYKYIIDYWGGRDSTLRTVPMMSRLKQDARYLYSAGEAMFEDPPL